MIKFYLVFVQQLENFFLAILRFYYLFDEILFLMNVIDEYIAYLKNVNLHFHVLIFLIDLSILFKYKTISKNKFQ